VVAARRLALLSNTTTVLTVDNPLTGGTSPFGTVPAAGATYQVGLVNRGQLVPQQLIVSIDAAAYFELVLNGALTGAAWTGLATLGSPNSLSEQDSSATAITGGERIWAGYTPAGGQGVQTFDLRNLTGLGTSLARLTPDALSLVATSFTGTANVAAAILFTEAMA